MRAANVLRSAGMLLLTAALLATGQPAWAAKGGQLLIRVTDRDTGQPHSGRMHLKNAAGKPVKGPATCPAWHDHFVFAGEVLLTLPVGAYTFEMECGPEYVIRMGSFTIADFANDAKVVDMKRFVDMSNEGWWAGDLNVQRPVKDLELLMLVEDLHVAEVPGWGSFKTLVDKSAAVKKPTGKEAKAAQEAGPREPLTRFDATRWYQTAAGLDARAGGSMLMFNLGTPLDLAGASPELPPSAEILRQVRLQPGGWVDAAHGASWDLPVWVAMGGIDSFELAGGNLCRNSVVENEPGTRPRDEAFFPGTQGVGRWPETIYYHLLNCGLHIPPSAGSASGRSPNPVGYNRAYVHIEGEPTYDAWWENFRAGRVVVTNGPMIRPKVEGQYPGHTFNGQQGQTVELEIGLTLSTREKIDYLEVIKNGRMMSQLRLDEWAKAGGRLPKLEFTESGWFLVRAVTNLHDTYRFASSGPYYVDIGYKPRISKKSAQFFLDWVTERARGLKLTGEEKDRALEPLRSARDYWQGVLNKATVE